MLKGPGENTDMYRGLVKEGPWAARLTFGSNREVGRHSR